MFIFENGLCIQLNQSILYYCIVRLNPLGLRKQMGKILARKKNEKGKKALKTQKLKEKHTFQMPKRKKQIISKDKSYMKMGLCMLNINK